MHAKFNIGDTVRIADKYLHKYNCITTTGEVLDVVRPAPGERLMYLVQFEGKKFKTWHKSYELKLDVPPMMLKSPQMKESQKISSQRLLEEIEKAIDTKNQKDMKKKFQIGDRVRIKSGWEKDSFGTIVKETKSRSGRIVYNVFIQKEHYKANRDYYSYDLELVSKPETTQVEEKKEPTKAKPMKEQPHFRMGDRVRLSEKTKRWLATHDADHAFIKNANDLFTIGVRWKDAGGRDCYSLCECAITGSGQTLKFYEEDLLTETYQQLGQKESRQIPKYQVGDKVRFTRDVIAKLAIEKSLYFGAATIRRHPDSITGVHSVVSIAYKNDRVLYQIDGEPFGKMFFEDELEPITIQGKPIEEKKEHDLENKEYLDCRTPGEYRRRLAGNWKEICNRYLQEFCHKHGYKYEPDMWVGSDPGTIIEVCDMFVSMDNIRYDVDNNIQVGNFEKWYWKNLELCELGVEHWMNYPSYCKGAPDEWTVGRMKNLREAHKRIHEAEEDLKRTIEEVKSKSVSGRSLA